MAAFSVSPTAFTSKEFDYLIVGGGTAGLCVAARLSEDPDVNVGILEAGGVHLAEKEIDVPGRYGEGIGSVYDWQYQTVPQRGLRGRRLPWPRGRLLGGTSALNFMTWNRPNREDLDAWAELGNEGWSWDDMLYVEFLLCLADAILMALCRSFYQKSEHFFAPDAADSAQHRLIYDRLSLGTDGPVPISYTREFSPSHRLWHDTLANLGVATNESHLSGSNVGAWTSIGSVDPRTMTRSWATPAYYLPHADRPNLVLLTEANVLQVVLEEDSSQWVAKGVRFEHSGSQYTARVTHEVILCAGSVASPQLLEVSGIGDPFILQKANIPVKITNPNVGENLQDHISKQMKAQRKRSCR